MDSKTVEDYLKTIYKLQSGGERAKTSQVAHKLGVTAGTVTEMLKRLARRSPPLLTYKQHYGVRLTRHGRKRALDVIRRHRLLETFLQQTLGLAWDEVHQEAEILEHCLSKRVTDALDKFLQFPRSDPHGEPIPDADGRIAAQSGLSLSALAAGQTFRVIRVQPVEAELLRYLKSEQIHIGTTGTLISRAPFDGPLTLRLRTGQSTRGCVLGRKAADQIFVEALATPLPAE